jgi:hypothetical protein
MALFDRKIFAQTFSDSTKADQKFHDGDDGDGGGKRAAWWRAKILTSSFLVHCRSSARGGAWSQEQLADALGVSRSYIAQVESLNSETKAPLDLLIQAATATGTPFQIGVPGDGENAVTKPKRRTAQNERTSTCRIVDPKLVERQR